MDQKKKDLAYYMKRCDLLKRQRQWYKDLYFKNSSSFLEERVIYEKSITCLRKANELLSQGCDDLRKDKQFWIDEYNKLNERYHIQEEETIQDLSNFVNNLESIPKIVPDNRTKLIDQMSDEEINRLIEKKLKEKHK